MAANELPAPASTYKSAYSPETRAALALDDARREAEWQYEREFAFRNALRVQAEMRGDKTPLELAGEALDDAALRFRRQAARPVLCESAFARAERRYLAAREAFLALLVDLTGQDAAALERRIAA